MTSIDETNRSIWDVLPLCEDWMRPFIDEPVLYLLRDGMGRLLEIWGDIRLLARLGLTPESLKGMGAFAERRQLLPDLLQSPLCVNASGTREERTLVYWSRQEGAR